jgi:hypothetical protein
MLVEIISYYVLDILKNDDRMVSYKLSVLVDVAKCALISFPFQRFFVLALYYYHFDKSPLVNTLNRDMRGQPFSVPAWFRPNEKF